MQHYPGILPPIPFTTLYPCKKSYFYVNLQFLKDHVFFQKIHHFASVRQYGETTSKQREDTGGEKVYGSRDEGIA